jgi:hypothetical protein
MVADERGTGTISAPVTQREKEVDANILYLTRQYLKDLENGVISQEQFNTAFRRFIGIDPKTGRYNPDILFKHDTSWMEGLVTECKTKLNECDTADEVLAEAIGTKGIVTIFYDPKAKKLRAQADDGVHGLANVAFPNALRTKEGQQYEVETLAWNGKNYRALGEIKPIDETVAEDEDEYPTEEMPEEITTEDDEPLDASVDEDDDEADGEDDFEHFADDEDDDDFEYFDAELPDFDTRREEADKLLAKLAEASGNDSWDDADGYESGTDEWTERLLYYSAELYNASELELLCDEYSKKILGVEFFYSEDILEDEENGLSEIGYTIMR